MQQAVWGISCSQSSLGNGRGRWVALLGMFRSSRVASRLRNDCGMEEKVLAGLPLQWGHALGCFNLERTYYHHLGVGPWSCNLQSL
ncbi:hypothetical protein QQP08_000139, partial [Theobroma cacao]